MRKNARKPPFVQGGTVLSSDTTVRNNDGYPLDKDGDVDLVATARELQAYETRVLTKKKSNAIPPKKKRK